MGELLAKHEENAKQASAKKPATKTTKKTVATKPRSAPASPRKEAPAVSRPVKRKRYVLVSARFASNTF